MYTYNTYINTYYLLVLNNFTIVEVSITVKFFTETGLLALCSNPQHGGVPILVAFYDMHGLQWDYSFPRLPHVYMYTYRALYSQSEDVPGRSEKRPTLHTPILLMKWIGWYRNKHWKHETSSCLFCTLFKNHPKVTYRMLGLNKIKRLSPMT
jgi:hypothetical protein